MTVEQADHIPTSDLLWDALQSLGDGIALYDADHGLVACNPSYKGMFPLIADHLIPGARWEDLVRLGVERGQYRDAIGHEESWLQNRLKAGVPVGQTIEISLQQGLTCEAQYSQTSRGGFIVVNTDITQRRQAEAVVRDQEAILRTVLDASPAAMVMARISDGEILYRSPDAVKFFGNTENALAHYVDPSDRQRYIEALKAQGRVDDYRITLLNAAGEPCATTSWGRTVEFEGDLYAITAIMDISQQQEREAMIRKVVEACPTSIQMTRATSGEVLFSSPETASLFGKVENAKLYYADPQTREVYLKKLRAEGSVTDFKAEYINAEGKRFWGSINARLIDYNGEDVIVSHTRDLSDQIRIETELSQQQDKLYQNEKLSAMGELLAGVAHELNNPLSVVVGHSLMLLEDCEDPETRRQVDKISQAAERCAKIVKTFLTMARQQPAKKERVDMADILHTAVDVARYGDGSNAAEIVLDIEGELPLVDVDPDQITQVFINLILNAEHAMSRSDQGGKISVTARPARDGASLLVSVRDDGPGIPEEHRGRIFEPFFTTKDVGEGTGLGLAMSHRIIQSHNGSITLLPAPQSGSVFEVSLPLATNPVSNSPEPAEDLSQIDKVRILILDDETDVAELSAEILERSGYVVDVFNEAGDALASMAKQDYALVISDLNMPDIDGRGFFENISRDFPHLVSRTGFVTGDTMGRSSQGFLSEAKRPFI
ncbi:MAG: ATP-binding protein, partial [Pseudomonadota bacterium]